MKVSFLLKMLFKLCLAETFESERKGKYKLMLQHFPYCPCEISEVFHTDDGPDPLDQPDSEG